MVYQDIVKIYKKGSPLTGHREEGSAIAEYPDGIRRTQSRNIAEMMVETHPEKYRIIETRPSKRPWLHNRN
jgi:hypothetical protein